MLRSFLRFRTGLRSLTGIERQLTRLVDLYEADLAQRGIVVRELPTQTAGEEPAMAYTDEEADFVREMKEKMGVRDV